MIRMKETSPSAASALPTEALAYPSAKYAWYVVVVLYLSYTFSFVDRGYHPVPGRPYPKRFADQ